MFIYYRQDKMGNISWHFQKDAVLELITTKHAAQNSTAPPRQIYRKHHFIPSSALMLSRWNMHADMMILVMVSPATDDG